MGAIFPYFFTLKCHLRDKNTDFFNIVSMFVPMGTNCTPLVASLTRIYERTSDSLNEGLPIKMTREKF